MTRLKLLKTETGTKKDENKLKIQDEENELLIISKRLASDVHIMLWSDVHTHIN